MEEINKADQSCKEGKIRTRNEDLFEENVVKIEYDPHMDSKRISTSPCEKESFKESVVKIEYDPDPTPVWVSEVPCEFEPAKDHSVSRQSEEDICSQSVKNHSEDGILKCDVCDKLFANRRLLTKHYHVHKELQNSLLPDDKTQLKCEFCNYTTDRKANLIRHVSTHSEVRPFKCDICDKQLKTNSSLKNHRNLHNGILRCGACGKSFPDKNQLTEHRNTHTKFKCDKCPYFSIYKKDFNNHIDTHSENRQYKCDVCEKEFKTHSYLGEHKMIHRGLLRCRICGKIFADKSLLVKHRKTHEQLKCVSCDFVTIHRSALKNHIRTHSAACLQPNIHEPIEFEQTKNL